MKKFFKSVSIILIALFIVFLGLQVIVLYFKKTIQSTWEKKLHTTDVVKTMYDMLTPESEFEEIESQLSSELINYLETKSGLSIDEMTDYDKIGYTAHWVGDYLEYDMTHIYKYSYDVFKYKTGDCVGYADLFYHCMKILDINSEIVTMNADIKIENFKNLSLNQSIKVLGIGHAINIVTIDDRNYFVDTCWYDASKDDNYILFGTEVFIERYKENGIRNMDYVEGYNLSQEVFSIIEDEMYIQ